LDLIKSTGIEETKKKRFRDYKWVLAAIFALSITISLQNPSILHPSFSFTKENQREREGGREGGKGTENMGWIAENVESIKCMKIRDTLSQLITLGSFSFSFSLKIFIYFTSYWYFSFLFIDFLIFFVFQGW